MEVMPSPVEDREGEDTYTIAIVNGLVDVREEVLDSLHELGRTAQQRVPSEMECNILVNGQPRRYNHLKQHTGSGCHFPRRRSLRMIPNSRALPLPPHS